MTESDEHDDENALDQDRNPSAESSSVEAARGAELLRKIAASGAQQAFQIDPAALANIKIPKPDLSGIIRALEIDWPKLSPDFTGITGALASAANFQLPPSFWEQFEFTRRSILGSKSVDSLYSTALLEAAKNDDGRSKPRSTRSPQAFFYEHAVEVKSVASLLKAFATVQSKQHRHRPVWRGQRDADWPVHSSLYRRLEESGPVQEDRLVNAEIAATSTAMHWNLSQQRPLEFLATLQHNGAPTRLIDVTLDPEIAAWFAVEADPQQENSDGLVIGWGRVPITRSGVSEQHEEILDAGALPFWHAWTTDKERHRVDWGTGTKTWTWFPPALNERMRAQRAGFLLEAGPILTSQVAEVFTRALSQDWRPAEVARATSVVGLPSRHDVLTKPNAANLVPIFTFRIPATAKAEIRDYLEQKGLTAASVYPDLGGLVRHLNGPFGL
jgi:hypothetical protein